VRFVLRLLHALVTTEAITTNSLINGD